MPKQNQPKHPDSILVVWSAALQLVIITIFSALLGYAIDLQTNFKFPVFLLLLLIIGLSYGTYKLLKQLNHKESESKK
jgi:F0F1-type ATP synthase assembly protein I